MTTALLTPTTTAAAVVTDARPEIKLPLTLDRARHVLGVNKYERRAQVNVSEQLPAGLVLEELFNMELLADDGNGNRAWGIPYDAADNPGWGERYRNTDPDGPPPAWLGEVQITTHALKRNGHEVAVLRSETMLPEFPFITELGRAMGSYLLLEAWLRGTDDHWTDVAEELLQWVSRGAARDQILPRLRAARGLVDIQHDKADLTSVPDLTGASPAAVQWASNVTASFMLGLNPNLKPGNTITLEQRQWILKWNPVEFCYRHPNIQTRNVAGVEVAYWLMKPEKGVPGMESRYTAVSSYGMLLAAVGSREAAEEIIAAYPRPCTELSETIQLFIDAEPLDR